MSLRIKNKTGSKTRKMEAVVTATELRERFRYDPITGELRRADGRVATNSGPRYAQAFVRGTRLSAHRIIWCMMTGKWPEHEVDHIDGNPRNNSWINLRLATPQENARWGRSRKSVTGHRGITLRPNGTFRVRIGVGARGNRKSVGDFRSLDDAIAARLQAENAAWKAGRIEQDPLAFQAWLRR